MVEYLNTLIRFNKRKPFQIQIGSLDQLFLFAASLIMLGMFWFELSWFGLVWFGLVRLAYITAGAGAGSGSRSGDIRKNGDIDIQFK